MSKSHYKVCINFRTVKGIEMLGKRFPVASENDRHVELYVVATGERVIFTRKEVL